MTIDRQMLELADANQCAIVRLYRWYPATLSLGHFQAHLDRSIHPASAGMPAVVRASGGGAIVHDHEWTYSIALPVGRNKVGAATELYDLVHATLVDKLRALGWDASLWTKPCSSVDGTSKQSSMLTTGCGTDTGKPQSAGQPFLCFARRSCGDIVCEGYKIVGSAQRRLGGSVLQHGSLLWHTSQFAQEILGLSQLPRRLPISSPDLAVVEAFLASPPDLLETLGELMLSWVVDPLISSFNLNLRRLSLPQANSRLNLKESERSATDLCT